MTINQVHSRTERFLHTVITVILLATLLAAFWASPASAQTRFLSLTGSVSDITLAPGTTSTIQTDREFADLVVGDPNVAEVVPLTERSVYVQGNSSGLTNISFYDERRNLLGVLKVRVQQDFRELRGAIAQALPGAQINVVNVNDRIRLSGNVGSQLDIQRALEIAQQYSSEPVVNALRITTAQQVELEVRILEVSRNAGRAVGTDLEGQNENGLVFATGGGALGNVPFGTAMGQLLEVAGVEVDLVISALESKGLARRLANPTLVTTSGIEANFVVGGEVPITSAVVSDTGSVAQGTTYREFGVRLSFLPVVLDNGLISLRVNPEVSDIDTSISVNGQPGFTTRKAETTVSLRDGQSFAIAGLLDIDNTRNIQQVPWLGQVPVLGALFRSTAFQKQETELVILVTPRLVQPATPDQPLRTPLDNTRSSNDVELFLLGMLEVDRDLLRRFEDGAGVAGPYGHIIDLEFDDGIVQKK